MTEIGCDHMASNDDRRAPLFRISLLGPMRLIFDDRPWKLIRSRYTLPIFAYLLVHRAEFVSRETLAFTLWPDQDEATAIATLRRYIYELQKMLPPVSGEPWLLVDAESARWNPAASAWLDVEEFEQCCGDETTLERADELYVGDLLENVYDDWAVAERERLRGLYRTVLDALVRRCRDRREHARAITYVQRLLARDPWREDVVRQLMSLHYESGNAAGALATYKRFSLELRAEMNVEPMLETAILRESIAANAPLPGDPARHEPARKRRDDPEIFPFVGRSEECADLRDAWLRAARGQGGFALVSGEAGIGKSRLVAEVARYVEREGGRTLRGATTHPEQTPYQCLTEALRSSLPLLTATDIAPIWLAVLTKLLPELLCRRTDLPILSALDPDREQLRLFESLARAFVAIAQPRPVLIVLEDLHWAGVATVVALRFLARRTLASRVLIVGTYRDEEVPRTHPMREIRREMEGEHNFVSLSLGGFHVQAVRDLVALVPALTSVGPDIASILYAQSEGHPLFLRELVADLIDSDSSNAGAPAATLPRGIGAIISARLARLTPSSRSVVEIAAVVGQTFNVEVLCEVTGWTAKQIFEALEESIDLHLVKEAATRSRLSFAFTHHLIASTVYDDVPCDIRLHRHRRIARVIEDIYRDRLVELATDLASHFDRGEEPELAAKYYRSAAHRAIGLYANDEARSAASRGLGLTKDAALRSAFYALRETLDGRRGDRTSQLEDLNEWAKIARTLEDEEMQSEIVWREILVHRALGAREHEARCIDELQTRADAHAQSRWSASARMARAAHDLLVGHMDDALASATDALERQRGLHDAAGQVECLCLLAEISAFGGRVAESRALLDEATSFVQAVDNPGLMCRATMSTSKAALLAQDFAESETLARTALELYRSIGDREGEADALARIAVGSGRRFRVEEARAYYAEAGAIYAAIGKRLGVAVVLVNSGLLANRVGDLETALTAYSAALRYFTDLGDVRGQTVCALNESFALLHMGEAAQAKNAAERGLTLARAIRDPALEAVALGNLGASERELGLLPAAISHIKAAVAMRPLGERRADNLDDLADLALAYLQANELDAARSIVDEIACAEGIEASDQYWPWLAYWVAAQVYHACNETESSERALETAYGLLIDRATSIANLTTRASLLTLPLNEELIAAREHGIWPARKHPTDIAASSVRIRDGGPLS